jgi:twinkle protein
MVQMNLLYDHLSETLYFPLLSFRNEIVGYKYLTAAYSEKTFPVTNAHGVILYKSKTLKPDENAVIVSNINDLLIIASNKATNLIICLPYGLQNIPQEILPCLESYKKFIIWFGSDKPNWNTARDVVKKLGETRCFFMRPMEYQSLPNSASNIEYNFKEILQNAQPIWHKSITTFSSLRQDILNDLKNIDKVQGTKWVRYPVLNKILKGHRRGEFTILTGPTGIKYSTFLVKIFFIYF